MAVVGAELDLLAYFYAACDTHLSDEDIVSRDGPTPDQTRTIGEEAAEELTDLMLSRFPTDDGNTVDWLRLASIPTSKAQPRLHSI